MTDQELSFSSLDYAAKKKTTKREIFLSYLRCGSVGRVRSAHRALVSEDVDHEVCCAGLEKRAAELKKA